jgi:hypothetical protein
MIFCTNRQDVALHITTYAVNTLMVNFMVILSKVVCLTPIAIKFISPLQRLTKAAPIITRVYCGK